MIYDWEEAARQFRLALAAEPVPAEVRGRCACNYLLPLGRLQEALMHFETVLDQDPLNIRGMHGVILSFVGLYEQALAEAQAAIRIDSSHWLPHFAVSLSHVMRSELVEARVAAETSVACAPWQAQSLGLLTGILANLGEVDRANELLSHSGAMAPTALFFYSLLRSDVDTAADQYAKMIEQRDPAAPWYAASNFLKPLRSSQRWPALAGMMNLRMEGL